MMGLDIIKLLPLFSEEYPAHSLLYMDHDVFVKYCHELLNPDLKVCGKIDPLRMLSGDKDIWKDVLRSREVSNKVIIEILGILNYIPNWEKSLMGNGYWENIDENLEHYVHVSGTASDEYVKKLNRGYLFDLLRKSEIMDMKTKMKRISILKEQ